MSITSFALLGLSHRCCVWGGLHENPGAFATAEVGSATCKTSNSAKAPQRIFINLTQCATTEGGKVCCTDENARAPF